MRATTRREPNAERLEPLGKAVDREGFVDFDPLHDLMHLVQGGDRDAFARLYVVVAPRVGAVLRRLLHRDQIEHASQEVFLRLWNSRGRFTETKGSITTWAATIARNHAHDLLRRESRAGATVRIEGAAQALADSQPDPAAVVEAADWAKYLACLLEQVLARAKPLARQAWELRWQGVPYAEVAQRLGVPQGTVATWIRGIRQAVRRRLHSLSPTRHQRLVQS